MTLNEVLSHLRKLPPGAELTVSWTPEGVAEATKLRLRIRSGHTESLIGLSWRALPRKALKTLGGHYTLLEQETMEIKKGIQAECPFCKGRMFIVKGTDDVVSIIAVQSRGNSPQPHKCPKEGSDVATTNHKHKASS